MTNRGDDAVAYLGVLPQEDARVVAALRHPLALKAEPGAALFDDALLGSEVKKVAFAGNPFAIQNIDLGVAERRRHFVLYHFDLRAVPDDLLALLQRADSADFDAH